MRDRVTSVVLPSFMSTRCRLVKSQLDIEYIQHTVFFGTVVLSSWNNFDLKDVIWTITQTD